MKRNKTLILFIIILLTANVITLFLLFNKDQKIAHNKNEAILHYLKQDIGFSSSQLKAYDSLFDNHKKMMKQSFESNASNRKKTFQWLAAQNFSDSAIKIAAEKNEDLGKVMSIYMMRHIKDIRTLCNEQQKSKFDTSFYKLFSGRKFRDK